MVEGYHLGGPVWGLKDWLGILFAPGSRPAEFLGQYASVFNAVEGNTTGYAIPTAESVARWRDATPESFQFCFKLPRIVTHQIRLRKHAQRHLDAFFEMMAPLGPRIGPWMIQLPPSFPPEDADILERFLRALPPQWQYSVELRHADLQPGQSAGDDVNLLLAELGMNRTVFDTRGLRDADALDPVVRDAQRKKPNLPWTPIATGDRPTVRYCAHSDVPANDDYLEFWAAQVAAWIGEGKRPYVFIHSPGDRDVPELCRRFHDRVGQHRDVGALPAFPGGEQLSLF